ncbi:LOW QUALITY PROTEIN: lipopolysaccharide-binding protein-like [Trichechus inunguis]
MMARPYYMVVALLLLAEVSRFGEGASNPGLMARITRKGLDYAHHYGVAALKKELSTMRLPDSSEEFKASYFVSVSYEFYRQRILRFEIPNSDLSLLPGQGVRASLSNNYLPISGNWKVKKYFITLQGTFDLRADDIFFSVSLNLGKDNSGRLTASVADCSSSINHVSIDISGHLSWILNLFHERIENKLKTIMQQKVNPVTPFTSVIDQVAGIDYSLVGAPQVTSQGLDIPFQDDFFSRSWRSPVPFNAPAIQLPQEHDHMLYFAVSECVFNTASHVYYQPGRMNFTIQNEHIEDLTKLANNQSARRQQKQHLDTSCQISKSTSLTTVLSCFYSSFLLVLLQIPLESLIHLDTNSLQALVPQLARLYPNMEIKLEISPESAPFLMFTPLNMTLMPVIDIQAFAFLPNSTEQKPLSQLRARTNISTTINVTSSRIISSVTTGSSPLSTVSFPAKLEKGFPLCLPKNIYLNSLVLQIHKNFLLLGANIDKAED